MNMKAYILSIAIMSVLGIQAQTIMNIHKSNGTILEIPLNTIDSITYTINNNANNPIIQSVTLKQVPTTGGTNILFKIVVASNAPVDWLNSNFYGPSGNLYGGGSGVQFTETSAGIWEYTRTDFVSEWSPSGTYYYTGISVKNAGELTSTVWSSAVTTNITNSVTATAPVIQNVTLQQVPTTGGTNILFKVVVASNAPVDWINSSFYGPSGNLYGGGSGVQFTETSAGIWEYTRTDFVSEWSPSGEYYYTGISVKNAGEITSTVWSSKVSINIKNSVTATTPIIQSVTLQQVPITGGTNILFKIIVASNAPVDWLNSSFYGPSGNLYGGGSGVQFTETSAGIWEYTRTDFVSEWSPSGEYYYTGISVKNAGEITSTVWSNTVTTKIVN
jgi:hypothetical protein